MIVDRVGYDRCIDYAEEQIGHALGCTDIKRRAFARRIVQETWFEAQEQMRKPGLIRKAIRAMGGREG